MSEFLDYTGLQEYDAAIKGYIKESKFKKEEINIPPMDISTVEDDYNDQNIGSDNYQEILLKLTNWSSLEENWISPNKTYHTFNMVYDYMNYWSGIANTEESPFRFRFETFTSPDTILEIFNNITQNNLTIGDMISFSFVGSPEELFNSSGSVTNEGVVTYDIKPIAFNSDQSIRNGILNVLDEFCYWSKTEFKNILNKYSDENYNELFAKYIRITTCSQINEESNERITYKGRDNKYEYSIFEGVNNFKILNISENCIELEIIPLDSYYMPIQSIKSSKSDYLHTTIFNMDGNMESFPISVDTGNSTLVNSFTNNKYSFDKPVNDLNLNSLVDISVIDKISSFLKSRTYYDYKIEDIQFGERVFYTFGGEDYPNEFEIDVYTEDHQPALAILISHGGSQSHCYEDYSTDELDDPVSLNLNHIRLINENEYDLDLIGKYSYISKIVLIYRRDFYDYPYQIDDHEYEYVDTSEPVIIAEIDATSGVDPRIFLKKGFFELTSYKGLFETNLGKISCYYLDTPAGQPVMLTISEDELPDEKYSNTMYIVTE